MSRLATLCAGLLMVTSLSGCCLLGHGCGAGYAPYGGYYGGGGGCAPCQSGACGAVAPGYPSAYNPAIPQAAILPPAQISANLPQPGFPQPGMPQQQMVMTDTLSTY